MLIREKERSGKFFLASAFLGNVFLRGVRIPLRQLTARKEWSIAIALFFLRSLNSKQYVVSININNNKQRLFFQKPIIFGCSLGLFVWFCVFYISFDLTLLQYTIFES